MPRRNWKASGYSEKKRKRTNTGWSDEKIREIMVELRKESGEKRRKNEKRKPRFKK